jgi:hypothetical protein
MHTYNEAAQYLGSKNERPVGTGRATRIRRLENGDIAIRYHRTDVVTYHADGTTTLNSGGYLTHTTKERINEYSSARIFQQKGLWYFAPRGFQWANGLKGCSLFCDGAKIDAEGQPLEPVQPEDTTKLKTKLDRLVSKYVKGYLGDLQKNGVSEPGPGDCWGCFFSVGEGGETQPLGVAHLLGHFEEQYYVPSIFFNALKASDYRDPGFILGIIKSDLRQGRESYHAGKVLRDYFRKLKPELLKALEQQG